MIKRGRIVIIGDEFFSLIAYAMGVDAYIFDDDCKKLMDWLVSNVGDYDVIIYLNTIVNKCKEMRGSLEKVIHEKILLQIDHPLESVFRDPKEYYREISKKILGVEVSL
ncbi:MAG: hypothetical protein QXE81_03750 [Desulfurococcaceae archaeon]